MGLTTLSGARDCVISADLSSRREYLAINPRGQVPALVDGDVRIYESVAIVEYLERRYPEPPLIPSEPKADGDLLSPDR